MYVAISCFQIAPTSLFYSVKHSNLGRYLLGFKESYTTVTLCFFSLASKIVLGLGIFRRVYVDVVTDGFHCFQPLYVVSLHLVTLPLYFHSMLTEAHVSGPHDLTRHRKPCQLVTVSWMQHTF